MHSLRLREQAKKEPAETSDMRQIARWRTRKPKRAKEEETMQRQFERTRMRESGFRQQTPNESAWIAVGLPGDAAASAAICAAHRPAGLPPAVAEGEMPPQPPQCPRPRWQN